MFSCKRPAGIPDALAHFEINWVGDRTPPSPMICRASEVTEAQTDVAWFKITSPYISTVVKRLRCLSEGGVATFEKHNTKAGIDELASQGNARGARPNDTNLCFNNGAGRNRPRVNEHATPV